MKKLARTLFGLLLSTIVTPAIAAGTGNCGQAFIEPTAANYSAVLASDGTTISAGNATGTSLPVFLPLPGAGGAPVGWTMCFVSENNKLAIPTAPSLAAPATPTLGQISGGSLLIRTNYVKTTYTNSVGETLPSVEGSFAISANNLLTVTSPGASGNAVSYNVYVGTASGNETLQNATPIALGTGWTEPLGGLVSGVSPPSSATATAAYILDGNTALASLKVGQDNYTIAQLSSDGTNFRITYASPETRQINGTDATYPWNYVYPGGPGYAATQNDNGNIISSGAASGGLTVTLPSTTTITAKWTMGLSRDASNGLVLQTNSTSGGEIIGENGFVIPSPFTFPASNAIGLTLQFDGANFRVLTGGAQPSGTNVPRQALYSANHGLNPADDLFDETISLETNLFTLTIPATSALPGFRAFISNTDSWAGHAKFLLFSSGGPNQMIWPGQHCWLNDINSLNVWSLQCDRPVLPGGIFTVYSNESTGSDTLGAADGLSTSTPFASHAGAAYRLFADVNWNPDPQTQLVIKLASHETETADFHWAPHDVPGMQGGAGIGVDCNGSTINSTSGEAFGVFLSGVVQLQNSDPTVPCLITSSTGNPIQVGSGASPGGTFYFTHVPSSAGFTFGALGVSGLSHLQIHQGGTVSISENINFQTGGAGTYWAVVQDNGNLLVGPGITAKYLSDYTAADLILMSGGTANWSASVNYNGHSLLAQVWALSGNSILANSSILLGAPGSTAGTDTPWTSYTPAVTCLVGGAPSSASAAGYYNFQRSNVDFTVDVIVTTIGPCSGAITVANPVSGSAVGNFTAKGWNDSTNTDIYGQLANNQGVFRMITYNGVNILSPGTYHFSGRYQTQPQ